MNTMKLSLNYEYDFNFLLKLLNENHPEQGNMYRKIKFVPKFSEFNGSIDHILIEFEQVYVSGENNFNE